MSAPKPVSPRVASSITSRARKTWRLSAVAHWEATTSATFATAPYHEAADPLSRVIAYIEFRKALLTGDLPDFTCFVGTIVQEAYRTHPDVGAACERSISGHARTLEADIRAAMREHGAPSKLDAREPRLAHPGGHPGQLHPGESEGKRGGRSRKSRSPAALHRVALPDAGQDRVGPERSAALTKSSASRPTASAASQKQKTRCPQKPRTGDTTVHNSRNLASRRPVDNFTSQICLAHFWRRRRRSFDRQLRRLARRRSGRDCFKLLSGFDQRQEQNGSLSKPKTTATTNYHRRIPRVTRICARCGSAMTCEGEGLPEIQFHIGTFTYEDASRLRPTKQFFPEERLLWVHPTDDAPR